MLALEMWSGIHYWVLRWVRWHGQLQTVKKNKGDFFFSFSATFDHQKDPTTVTIALLIA